MSSRPSLARLATDALARAEESPPPIHDAAREARAVALLADAIEGAARARRRRRSVASVVALSAAAAVGLLASRVWHRDPAPLSAQSAAPLVAPVVAVEPTSRARRVAGRVAVVHPDGRPQPVEEAAPLSAGDRLVASEEARAGVELSTGTRIALDADTDLAVVEQGPAMIFALARGSLGADVVKLRAGERFVVRTRDAEVEVHGTSFRVEALPPEAACAGAMTRVRVSEGVVTVRQGGVETKVARDQVWPASCEPPASVPPPPVATPERRRASSPRAVPPPGAAAPAASAPEAAPSDLAVQNALLAEATSARGRGDTAAAIAAYDRLLARYPASWLAETAMVERMRLLETSDRARARDAARAYLARYPGGFARAEAARVEGQP